MVDLRVIRGCNVPGQCPWSLSLIYLNFVHLTVKSIREQHSFTFVQDLLGQVGHYSEKVRKDALQGMIELLTSHPAELKGQVIKRNPHCTGHGH